jgi:excisionase family DNA binding protein
MTTNSKDKPQRIPEIDGFLTKENVAQKAQCSIRTVDKLMERKAIPFIKFGRNVRFKWSAVEAALMRYEHKAVS